MTSGRRHARYTFSIFMLTVLAGIAITVLVPSELTALIAVSMTAGAIAGHLITPDLDLRRRTHEERRLGLLWTILWYPYAVVMQHRGWSHTVPQGTLSRMIYIGVPLAGLLWLAGLRPGNVSVQLYCVVGFAAAWFIQDLSHLTLDGLFPGRAPWRRPRWQPKDD